MGNLDSHYTRRIKDFIEIYNRYFPLPYYFGRFLRGKKEVKIADLGAGPVCTLGNLWAGVKIEIYASDTLAVEYNKLVDYQNCKLIIPIEYQDMQNLSYPDNFFDVVHCVNALDHVKDVKKAISEMKRVCKPGGFVYLRHGHNQKKANGGKGHFWDAKARGFFDGKTLVTLDGFHTFDDGHYLISTFDK